MERLQQQLADEKGHLEIAENRREKLIQIIERYKNSDQCDLNEEEIAEKTDAEKRLNIVNKMIATHKEHIRNYEREIDRLVDMMVKGEADVEGSPRQGPAPKNQIVQPAVEDNSRPASALSGRSSRRDDVQFWEMNASHDDSIKCLEAIAKSKRLEADMQYKNDIEKLQHEIEDDEEALAGTQPGAIAKELLFQIQLKKKKLKRLEGYYERSVNQIQEKLKADCDVVLYKAATAKLGDAVPPVASRCVSPVGSTGRQQEWSRFDPQPVVRVGAQNPPRTNIRDRSVDREPYREPYHEARPDKDTLLIEALTKLLKEQRTVPSDKFLPEFNGDPGQWIQFKAHYDRTHRKFGLTNDENMSRLARSLKGTAAKAVQHLMTNPKNVQAVMDTLERRFGRPEYVIDYLTEKVKGCKRVDTRYPETIIEFGSCVSALVENIKTFKMPEYLRNAQLLRELLDKLPNTLIDDWMDHRVHWDIDASDIEMFEKWLNAKVEAALMRHRPTVGRQAEQKEERSQGSKRRGVAVIAEGLPETQKPRSSQTYECNVCHAKNHRIDNCWSLKKKSIDERWKLAREAGVCFSCLKDGHRTIECKESKVCGIDGCTRKHHMLLHSKPSNSKTSAPREWRAKQTQEQPTTTTSDVENKLTGNIGLSAAVEAAIIKGTDGPLPIVPVKVKCGNRVRKTHALLDSGATRTLITNDLAKDIGIQGKPIDFSYTTMSGGVVKEDNATLVDFSISGKTQKSDWYNVRQAITVKRVGLRPYSIDVEAAKLRWPHLKGFKGPSLRNVQPEIVIGSDHGYLTMHRQLLYADPDQPIAVKTDLGWVLQGQFGDTNQIGSLFQLSGIEMDATLDKLIMESFKLSNVGEKHDESTSMSVQDKKALEIMESTAVQRNDQRWEIGLLWKNREPFPKTMYETAYSRLRKTEARMIKNPEFASTYKNKIKEYQEKGYIRKLSEQEAKVHADRTGYIPHFGVVSPNKPGKFRLVFDCAAIIEGKSFNDFLLTGPDLIRPLPAVLWNFRRHKFVICGDIEDMFHRVFIQKEDRQAQRFLWRDGESSRDPDVYEMMVMIFGATSSPSCAIFVKNKNAENFNDTHPEVVRAIKEDMYVDDCLTGGDTEEKVSLLRKNITDINLAGGFVIKKWLSNSKQVMSTIPNAARLDGYQKSIGETERVLGLYWDPKKDVFTFRLNFSKVKPEIMAGGRPTKRQMCGLIMSLFDPLGFVANFKIKAMMLFQEVWKTQIGWDDHITDEVYTGWSRWVKQLTELPQITIPRWYGKMTQDSSVQLHTFSDASTEGMASVCYLRIQNGNNVQVAFVVGKAKVAPTKKSTIPRLELCAALMGGQMAAAFLKESPIRIEKCVFWSDSTTALTWIKSDSTRYKEFVANRVTKIQNLTNMDDWRWLSTDENPADDGTRLSKSTELKSESRWLMGPAFLIQPEGEWPEKNAIEGATLSVAGEETKEKQIKEVPMVPDSARFSSYNRLLRATAGVIAAAEYWLQRIRKKGPQCAPWGKANGANICSNLKSEHLQAAEIVVLKTAQKSIDFDKAQKMLLSTKLFRDAHGLIRVHGRIGDNVEGEVKHPILLPGKDRIVELLIDVEHHKNFHCGRNTVFNLLRQKYYIPSGRNAVRRAWSRCLTCKLAKASPVIPEMGIIPDCRTNSYKPPFTYTGADLFGPIEVTVGRRHEKRWGLLLTCMVTRAVHIEIISGLSLDDTMMGLSRFVDIRSLPKHFYSDNGTNFVAAAKEIGKHSKYNGLTWHFIPSAAPHMGGAWESLIKQVKRALQEVLKESFPRDQVLLTAIKAVENVVNSRPLSYASNDPNDDSALTPNHFLRGVGVASDESNIVTSNSADLCGDIKDERGKWGKSWERAQVLANQFWGRWSNEVLPDLLRRNKWNVSREPVAVGDVVLMVDELKPRGQWCKAIVSQVFPGKDGIVRVVEVFRRDPRTHTVHRFKRAVAKICPIGLSCSDLATVQEQVGKSGAGNGRKCVEKLPD